MCGAKRHGQTLLGVMVGKLRPATRQADEIQTACPCQQCIDCAELVAHHVGQCIMQTNTLLTDAGRMLHNLYMNEQAALHNLVALRLYGSRTSDCRSST